MNEISVEKKRNESQIRAELLISYVLRYGVFVCAAFLLVGLILVALAPPGEADFALPANHHPVALYSPLALWPGLLALHSDAWLATGVLILIGLPILRVALTVILFLLEKDTIYFFITLFVLVVLLSGIYFGKTL